MQAELDRANRQRFLLIDIIGELQKQHANSVDIENSLYGLSAIGKLSPQQSQEVLRLAQTQVPSWLGLEGIDAGMVMRALVGPITTLQETQPNKARMRI